MNLSPLSVMVGDSDAGDFHSCCMMRPSKASLLAATAANIVVDERSSSDSTASLD